MDAAPASAREMPPPCGISLFVPKRKQKKAKMHSATIFPPQIIGSITKNPYFCFQNVNTIKKRTTLIIKDMDKLDKLDKKILSILSQNARIPFKDVAAECNVSRAAIHQRVQHMREDGVITGSGFDVNPKSIGYTTCTYVGITLERGSMYKSVVERLVHISEIVECHFTTGPYTMLVKLFARDNEQLMDLLNNQLQGIPGVVATETLISLEQSIKREIPVIADDND